MLVGCHGSSPSLGTRVEVVCVGASRGGGPGPGSPIAEAYNVGQKQPGCWSPTDRCWSPSARDVGSQAQDGHTLMTLVHGFVVEQTDLTSLK